ncbi:MAG: HEPN domain-containing protein [Candidatus Bathyarchaeia archaeon]
MNMLKDHLMLAIMSETCFASHQAAEKAVKALYR